MRKLMAELKNPYVENNNHIFSSAENEECLDFDKMMMEVQANNKEIEDLYKNGYCYNQEDNTFRYEILNFMKPLLYGSGIFIAFLFTSLPAKSLTLFLTACLLSVLVPYLIFNKNFGIYSRRMKKIKKQKAALQELLKNDDFKIALLLSLEKKVGELTHNQKNTQPILTWCSYLKDKLFDDEATEENLIKTWTTFNQVGEKINRKLKNKELEERLTNKKNKVNQLPQYNFSENIKDSEPELNIVKIL